LLRGHALHLLLEHLPHWPETTWEARAADLLAGLNTMDGGALSDAAALLIDAKAVLSAPDLALFFTSDALAEVEITARLGRRTLTGVIRITRARA
jgi:ATP-dependent helicase/nuclease subunit A